MPSDSGPPSRRALARRLAAVAAATCTALALAPLTPAAADHAASPDLVEHEVTFSSHGLEMHGSVIAPAAAASTSRPGLVMVHGSGRKSREGYRLEAEGFARAGIVTLIYDKRPKSSVSDVDFALLADDALAAAQALRSRPDVQASDVGLLGISEGGWVAPLAASRSTDVAFVITVGGSGVPPGQQQSWNLANRLTAAGVSGSMVDAVSRTTVGLLVGAGLFPEGTFDPVPVLERVAQPVLGLWGDLDRVIPGAESMQIFREALERGRNSHYTLRSVPGAEHTMRRSTDGFDRIEEVSSTYIDLVGSWVGGLAAGPPAPSTGTPPQQERQTVPVEAGSPWPAIGLAFVLALVFGGFTLAATARRVRRRGPGHGRPAAWLAVCGLLSVLGLFGYLVFLAATGARTIGPLVLSRPLPWLALQALALCAAGSVAVAVVAAWRSRAQLPAAQRIRLGALLAAGVAFVPWAIQWGLLLP